MVYLWILRRPLVIDAGGATEIAELLGKEETIRRLDFSIALLNK